MRRAAFLAPALFAALSLTACERGQAEPVSEEAAAAIQVDEIDAAVMATRIASGDIVLVDVRTPEEFAEGHIEGAVNLPLDTFDPAAVPHGDGKEAVLYCRSGRRSEIAAETLSAATGKPATHLDGGIVAWEAAGQPVVSD